MRAFAFYRSFDARERRMFWLLLGSSVFDGLTQGVILLQETIAKKALGASDFQVTMIGVIATATMIFSVLVGLFFSGRSKTGLLAASLVAGRLVFLAAFLVETPNWYMALLFAYHAAWSIQSPVFNSFFQRHLARHRGRVFGLSRTVTLAFSMAAALACGRLLDADPSLYKPVLAAVAATGSVMYLLYIAMDRMTAYRADQAGRVRHALRSYRQMLGRSDFMLFEAMFMVYGLAFMVMVPAVPLFLINKLQFSYFQMAQASGFYSQIFIILLMPLAGALYDRADPWKVAAASIAVLLGYPLLFAVSHQTMLRGFAYGGLAFFSLGLTGIQVLWNLGSLHFDRGSDAFIYQGFHVTLTGLRGVAGPLAGYWLLSRFGFMSNFAVAFGLFALAGGISLLGCRRYGGCRGAAGSREDGHAVPAVR